MTGPSLCTKRCESQHHSFWAVKVNSSKEVGCRPVRVVVHAPLLHQNLFLLQRVKDLAVSRIRLAPSLPICESELIERGGLQAGPCCSPCATSPSESVSPSASERSRRFKNSSRTFPSDL